MNLSEHFSYEELIISQTASRRGLDNTPPADILPHLIVTAQGLERVRALLGHPIIVSSGYRAPEVNRLVGGASDSAHCLGYAADWTCPAFGTPRECAIKVRDSGIVFDQLIMEFGDWVHLSFDPRMRRQSLTAHFSGGHAAYTEGIA